MVCMKYKVGDLFTWNSIKEFHYFRVLEVDKVNRTYCFIADTDADGTGGKDYIHTNYSSQLCDKNTTRYKPSKLEKAME